MIEARYKDYSEQIKKKFFFQKQWQKFKNIIKQVE